VVIAVDGRPAEDRRLAALARALVDWLLLDANRYLVAGGLLVVVFSLVLWLQLNGITDVARDNTPLLYLFSALVGGNITLVTIVISINQLVLSRELRSPRELETELQATEEYRGEIESEIDRPVTPETPEDFLQLLVRDTRRQLAELGDAVAGTDDGQLRREIADLQENLDAEMERTLDRLERTHSGTFPTLSTVLDANFSTRINHSRWLRQTNDHSLRESTRETLVGLEDRLEQLDVARQYFKTIYIQQELARLSKEVLYVGLVAEFVAIVLLLWVGYGYETLLARELLWLSPAVTLAFAPLALLASHVLRISTIAARTTAITPFLTPR